MIVKKNIAEREIKIPITRLKKYLNEVGITIQAMSEMSGISRLHLQKCLDGVVDQRNGRKRTMSDDALAQLQEALHQMALDLKYIFIFYNKDREVCRRNGNCYCPDCVDQIKEQLSKYFSISPFMQYALGWNQSKICNIMNCKDGFAYGNISQDDCERINVVLAEISTRLDRLVLIKG